jgi:hypothetical protein
MAAPENKTDPVIRYVAVPGRGDIKGRCAQCKGTGQVGNFCFPCCEAADLNDGKCPDCEQRGPIGLKCPVCGRGEYLDVTPMGRCPKCNSEGVLGCPCSHCDDAAVVYKTPWWAVPIGPEPTPDPTVRFVQVLGVKPPKGICIPCQREGWIGEFCYYCCRKAGMDMGTCFVCEDKGPIDTWCQDCGEAPYEERTNIGHCPRCGEEGRRGCLCLECEDMSLCYE